MKVLLGAVCAVLMLSASMAMAAPDLVVFGDSTGKGDGAQQRWATRLVALLGDGRRVENFSRSRNSIDRIWKSVEEAPDLTAATVLVYDRRNAGETVEAYLARLHAIAERVGHGRLLILPQVPVSGGREDGTTLPVLLAINERILADFPDNTFDAVTRDAFLAALDADATRSDRIHRNDVGQQIEADYIGQWVRQRGF